MNATLLNNNYIVIPNFIDKSRAISLSDEFKQYVEENRINGDDQALNSSSVYNYRSFLELLCEKCSDISSIIGETVFPTYSYARVYRKGSDLEVHTDRGACEISISLNLDSDKIWSFWIKTPSGEDKAINLNPGDAILYLGCVAPHWREKFDGEWCTQVFLHYVRSNGPFSDEYFNIKNNNKHAQLIDREDCIISQTTSGNLEEYIKVFDNVIPNEICDLILEEYKDSNDWKPAQTGDLDSSKTFRNCDIIGISKQATIQKNPEQRKKIDDAFFEVVGNVVQKYADIFGYFDIKQDSGYDLLRYEEGGFYSIHTDSYKEEPRAVSFSFILNDDFEGGEFAFFDRKVVIKPSKGSVIVFPSNFMYPHEVMKVTKGTRYSIVTWFS